METSVHYFVYLFVTFLMIFEIDGLRFHLKPGASRCVKEEIRQNVLIVGDFEVSEVENQKVDYVVTDIKGYIVAQHHEVGKGKFTFVNGGVTDSKGHILAQHHEVGKGKFTFVTEVYDMFEVCFTSRMPPHMRGSAHEVYLIIKRGVEAKSYEGLSEAAKLKPMEVELKRLEDLSESIVQDFVQMRQREREMRDTNESTNNRVLYFSIFSMCCLLGLATWQVLYLRRFFKAKKLIE